MCQCSVIGRKESPKTIVCDFDWVCFISDIDFINLFAGKSNRRLDIANQFLLFVYDSSSIERIDAFWLTAQN